MHPHKPEIIYAGTQLGPYRSDDRGDHWRALNGPRNAGDVWSLAFHPQDPDVIYIGYDPCAIYRSEDGGSNWRQMNTKGVIFPHITTYMLPLGKRVIEIASDPSNPMDMYAAVEVGGVLASRDGGERWSWGILPPAACIRLPLLQRIYPRSTAVLGLGWYTEVKTAATLGAKAKSQERCRGAATCARWSVASVSQVIGWPPGWEETPDPSKYQLKLIEGLSFHGKVCGVRRWWASNRSCESFWMTS